MDVHRLLEPPVNEAEILQTIPELALGKGLEQGPYHHLDVFGHTMEVVAGVERELEENRLGARVCRERVAGLRLVGLLHDVAKPITRGEYEGKVLFVAHDTLGARLAYRICRRLGISAGETDLVATLTALHLKIGFMGNERSNYRPPRLARAAGPFGEELAVLSWADRLAAQGPRLQQEHLDRHHGLCAEFLRVSREHGPYPSPNYERPGRGSRVTADADLGYASSRVRLRGA
ncbi:MAG: HD domain-containing protein [Rubrobacteraceae bacterium]